MSDKKKLVKPPFSKAILNSRFLMLSEACRREISREMGRFWKGIIDFKMIRIDLKDDFNYLTQVYAFDIRKSYAKLSWKGTESVIKVSS